MLMEDIPICVNDLSYICIHLIYLIEYLCVLTNNVYMFVVVVDLFCVLVHTGFNCLNLV